MSDKKSKISNALPVLRVKAPEWSDVFASGDEASRSAKFQSGFTFDNIFVYNFFTQNERKRYSFENPNFYLNHIESNERASSLLRDFSGGVLNNNLLKKTRENIPSFINLKWNPPRGFSSQETIASSPDIEAFKVLANISNSSAEEIFREFQGRLKPVSTESFELQQSDYNNMTNEYLDMFAWSGNKIVNQYFVEEVDGTKDLDRINFVIEKILDNESKYKNALYSTGPNSISNPDSLRRAFSNSQRDSLSNEAIGDLPANSIVDVNDSSLLENLNFPTKSSGNDIIVAHNSDFSWSIAQASAANSGLILSMQSRIRNARFWKEYIDKFSKQVPEDLARRRIKPLEEVIENTFPFQVLDISAINVTENPSLKLVGFVIEKKQTIEPAEHADSLSSREIKFPLIFIPCETNKPVVNNYLDAAINYDKEYDYHIRAVFTLTMDVEVSDPDGETVYKRLKYFVNSQFSKKLTIETREVTPPPFPRDVWAFHEYYTDDDGALALHWAFPVNKQRDTAYFAIFRRRSIYEPFQLKEIFDFNFSISDPVKSRQEIKLAGLGRDKNPVVDGEAIESSLPPYEDRVSDKVRRLKAGDPNTVYIDRDFEPDNEYIYAVCAIDAHGQISNYSSQIKVRLNKKPYKLEVRTISSPGAPLIFPNYFLDSKMFLDVARSARYTKATLRFRPDYKKVKLNQDGTEIKKIVKTMGENSINSYYLQIMNPDRGEQVLLKYQINDIVETVVNEEERRIVANLTGIPEEDLIL